MQEQVRALRTVADELAATRGRAPRAADLATELGWTEEDVVATSVAAATRAPVRLERRTDEEDDAPPAPGELFALHVSLVRPRMREGAPVDHVGGARRGGASQPPGARSPTQRREEVA